MRPDADTSWFTFSVKNVAGAPDFAVYAFSGREDTSASYEFGIELANRSSRVDLDSLLGKVGLLTITDRSGGKRYVHGYIREMEQLHTAITFTHYRCVLGPRSWFLDQNCDHRIFQNKMAIPRIGHEVIVSFLEGNPDRPLITGRVYHDLNMPPYELPANKTRTVFKSMSTPGQKHEARGFNELRIEDKRGEEEIYVHAEKDVNAYVKNDWKEHILHDRHQTVDHFTYLKTEGETHETLQDQRKVELFANDNLTVHADSHTNVDGKWLGKAGTEIHLQSGDKMVLEAGTELTGKAGGSWIKLDASGVHIDGQRIDLGAGGSPGNGSGASPLLPIVPEEYEKSFTILDAEGKPVANAQYRLVSDSGITLEGKTDEQGHTGRILLDKKEPVKVYYCLLPSKFVAV
jgi:hypothetical protein